MVKTFSEYLQVKEQAAPTGGGNPPKPEVASAQTQLDELERKKKEAEALQVQLDNKIAALQAATFTNYKVKIEPSGKI